MINELLDMAKIEAGRMEVAVGQVSVAEVLEGIAAIMRPLAESRGAAIEVERDANLPTLETDPGKLQQILYNFLSNAVKFSPEDGVVIVGAEPVARDGLGAIRISVTDHGPGIPEDMQDTVFEKFRQVDASHTRAHSGTGLGLAIVKHIAIVHGGSIEVASAPSRGSVFTLRLPADQPDPAVTGSSPATGAV